MVADDAIVKQVRMLSSLQPSSSIRPCHRLKWVMGAACLVGLGIVLALDLPSYVSFTALQNERENLLAFSRDHYVLTVFLFILLSSLTTALSIPIDIILALAGGYLFGSLWGTVYVGLGATSGAALAFLGTRYLFRDLVQARLSSRAHVFQTHVAAHAFVYLLTLRLIPLVPFTLLNLLSALTTMPFRTFVGATALGILPCSFVLTYAGGQLVHLTSLKGILSLPVILGFSALAVLALIPLIYQNYVIQRFPTTKFPRTFESLTFCSKPVSCCTPGHAGTAPSSGEPHAQLSSF